VIEVVCGHQFIHCLQVTFVNFFVKSFYKGFVEFGYMGVFSLMLVNRLPRAK
jgi:hypothetical protein